MTMPLRMLGESALWVPKAENDQKKVKFIKMLIKVYVKPILIFLSKYIPTHILKTFTMINLLFFHSRLSVYEFNEQTDL